MTVEFLEGKRKKFISPVSLFLFLNLIYFFVNPLSDYSLPLYDQAMGQVYSPLIKPWVMAKLENEQLDQREYMTVYQNMSDDISKAIMILNVPVIALFIFAFSFKKRKYYFDSLIFSFHYFTLFLTSWISFEWVRQLLELLLTDSYDLGSKIVFYLFAFVIPYGYAVLSIRKFLSLKWPPAIIAGLFVVGSVTLANLVYRFIIFLLTFWAT